MFHYLATVVKESGLVPMGSRVLVGYSGGPDSTALLYTLHKMGHDVAAAHLIHGQRAEAEAEADKCQVFCESLNIPFVLGRADVPQLAADHKIGIEEAGRKARYDFFRQAAVQAQAELIATGHTRDDQVETVLFNLIRGTGMRGLAGIPPQRGTIVRPFLTVIRAHTRMLCEDLGLWFHDDPGNLDVGFDRVRMRLRVLPEIEKIREHYASHIQRTATLVREEDEYLDNLTAHALQSVETPLNGPLRFLTESMEVQFDRLAFCTLPPVLQRRAVRMVTRYFGSSMTLRMTEKVVAAIRAGVRTRFHLTKKNVSIAIDAESVHMGIDDDSSPFKFPLTVPGITESPVFGWQITAAPVSVPSDFTAYTGLQAVIDPARLAGPLHLRSYDASEQLVAFGSTSPQKVSEHVRKLQLTSLAKRRLPIIHDMTGIVWIPGGRIADRVAVTPQSDRALRMAFEPLQQGQGS